jgi:GAF domain-containing protein
LGIHAHIVEHLLYKPPRSVVGLCEDDRHQALQDLHILDTASEDRYDQIVELARRRFNAPVAAIGFMDTNREWFKATAGTVLTELPRSAAICEWTIQGRTALLIDDAKTDTRFEDLDLVINAGIRSYAGHPILSPTGVPVGAICVLDTRPRKFTLVDASFLRELAAIVENHLLAPISVQ